MSKEQEGEKVEQNEQCTRKSSRYNESVRDVVEIWKENENKLESLEWREGIWDPGALHDTIEVREKLK